MAGGGNGSPTATGAAAPAGLDPAEAAARLAREGPNELPERPPVPLWRRALGQLREPMALLLLAAALVTGVVLRELADAAAIMAIVLLNAAIGLVEEGRAERALAALRRLEAPTTTVRRGGVARVIPARDVVPGDVVLLAAGDRVPADLELVEAAALEVDESLLTGESLPVAKAAGGQGGAGADQASTVFSGTLVTRGTGTGVAVATGPRTRLGRIAAELERAPQPTPLQRELGHLTARLGWVAAATALGVLALTLVRVGLTSAGLGQAFLTAVALAVAAVPEGLATVVAVALALGVRRMALRGAIVRRLPAVETLGSTTVIATDKTGTLTQNRLRLELVGLASGPLASPTALPPGTRAALAEVAVLCNDAVLEPPGGDPVDLALLEGFADEARRLPAAAPRLASLPFDAERRRMTTLHRTGGRFLLAVKGAPEAVLPACTRLLTPGGTAPLDGAARERALRRVAELAGQGVRVLALARRTLPEPPADLEAAEAGLELVGLVGLRDPLRPAAPATVAEARRAGIRLVMVTGDHPGTAAAVAREAGLALPGAPVVTGAAFDGGQPGGRVDGAVYARVDPAQKLALVRELQDRGEVVAVTGDGVNDAPALRHADIGVAMGRSGSEVAREAADMVVTDDDLATLVAAVREGRGIYDNIRKVVDYLLAGNLAEVMVVVGALLAFPGLGVPLLPLQLLWINLLTDGLPALALGVDPPDPGLMDRPPRPRGQRLLSPRRLRALAARGLVLAAAALAALAVSRFAWGAPWEQARAVMFTTLVAAHLGYALVARGPDPAAPPPPPTRRRRPANPRLALAIAGGLLLQILIVLLPAARPLFGTAPLGAREWALAAAGGVVPLVLLKLEAYGRCVPWQRRSA